MSDFVKFSYSGDFKNTFAFLNLIKTRKIDEILAQYGQKGCDILANNTPKKTGATASSWRYETVNSGGNISIEWHNDNMDSHGGTPVAILIIKGHGTGTGGYVPPNDFVSPVMEPLFNEISEAVRKVLTS